MGIVEVSESLRHDTNPREMPEMRETFVVLFDFAVNHGVHEIARRLLPIFIDKSHSVLAMPNPRWGVTSEPDKLYPTNHREKAGYLTYSTP